MVKTAAWIQRRRTMAAILACVLAVSIAVGMVIGVGCHAAERRTAPERTRGAKANDPESIAK